MLYAEKSRGIHTNFGQKCNRSNVLFLYIIEEKVPKQRIQEQLTAARFSSAKINKDEKYGQSVQL